MKSILIAEDEADFAAMLRNLLSGADYEVRVVSDGRQVIKLCEARPPDVLITDVFMPDKDGFEVIQEVRRLFPKVKILAMSGHPTAHEMLAVARQLGADLAISKPFVVEEILPLVARLVA